jgi:hypothetical protein
MSLFSLSHFIRFPPISQSLTFCSIIDGVGTGFPQMEAIDFSTTEIACGYPQATPFI